MEYASRAAESVTGAIRFEPFITRLMTTCLQLNLIAEHRGQCGCEFRPQRHRWCSHF